MNVIRDQTHRTFLRNVLGLTVAVTVPLPIKAFENTPLDPTKIRYVDRFTFTIRHVDIMRDTSSNQCLVQFKAVCHENGRMAIACGQIDLTKGGDQTVIGDLTKALSDYVRNNGWTKK